MPLFFCYIQKNNGITLESPLGMISNLFILFLLIGFSGAILSKKHYARFVSFIITIVCSLLIFFAYQTMQSGISQQAIWSLLDYKRFSVDLNLSSNSYNYSLLMPFFIMLFLSLLHTVYASKEEYRGRLSSLMFIAMAFFILMACSNNILLLIVGASLVGIIGIYIINDFFGKKTYVFYTLIADMSIFTATGIIYSSTSSLDLSLLSDFIQKHTNTDVVALLLVVGIAVKSGLFLFHNQVFSYRDLSFNRLIFLYYCISPACGLILFSKMHDLFYVSDMAYIVFLTLAVASVIYGFGGVLIYDNLKEKALSLNILLWGGLFSYSLIYQTNILPQSGMLIILFFLLNLWISEVSLSGSGEIYISRLGGTWKKLPLLLVAGIILNIAILQFFLLKFELHFYLLLISAIIILLLSSYLIRQIFFGINTCDEKVWTFMKHPPLLFVLPMFILPFLSIYNNGFSWIILLGSICAMIILIMIYPLQKISILYERDDIQLSVFFERVYEILLAPINILGRILWLTVDFLLIERTILSSISHLRNAIINLSSRMHSCRLIGYILTILLGLLIVFIGVINLL